MITRLKNFEGYWFTCACCGKEIKHPYAVKGMTGVFGSECVWKMGCDGKIGNVTLKMKKAEKEYQKELAAQKYEEYLKKTRQAA